MNLLKSFPALIGPLRLNLKHTDMKFQNNTNKRQLKKVLISVKFGIRNQYYIIYAISFWEQNKGSLKQIEYSSHFLIVEYIDNINRYKHSCDNFIY